MLPNPNADLEYTGLGGMHENNPYKNGEKAMRKHLV